NLRCRYCYADAGRKNSDMPMEIAKAAIDLVSGNAGRLGLPQFAVGFHGGGEPTVAWDLVSGAVEYARETADRMGMDAEIFAATNGLFNEAQREFIVENFTNLNISIDGPQDIQDHNRPTINGSGSFAIIKENLKFFDRQGFSYGVRSTITAKDVHRIAEIVEWFKSEFNISFLHLEPVWQCGRCLKNGETSPADADFIKYFIEGLEKAKEIDVDLIYSGLRVDSLISKFCGASGDGFNVLPEGIVTSCYEVTESDSPKAELFHYGKFDNERKEFIFDKKKIERLQRYSVENIEFCRDCFCKWHCAGDCISKVFDASGSFEHKGSSRCDLNRQLTIFELERLLTTQNI
ncbi:MAG: radical SAM protein, partial [Prolixibacteraceae bacterium]|nr:radical SAM protein [Prolixibacteraceae bacterium]